MTMKSKTICESWSLCLVQRIVKLLLPSLAEPRNLFLPGKECLIPEITVNSYRFCDRAHPSAPNKPPFETIVGLMTAPLDKLLDAFAKFPTEEMKAEAEKHDH